MIPQHGPFEVLHALRDARGWTRRTPTPAQIERHAKAHEWTHLGSPPCGLWAARDRHSVALVGLHNDGHPGGECVFPGLGSGMHVELVAWAESAEAWLRLTPRGLPVLHWLPAADPNSSARRLHPTELLPTAQTGPGPFPWNYRMRVRITHLVLDGVLPEAPTVGDLATVSADQLLGAEGFGPESLALVRAAVARAGLSLAGEALARRKEPR